MYKILAAKRKYEEKERNSRAFSFAFFTSSFSSHLFYIGYFRFTFILWILSNYLTFMPLFTHRRRRRRRHRLCLQRIGIVITVFCGVLSDASVKMFL